MVKKTNFHLYTKKERFFNFTGEKPENVWHKFLPQTVFYNKVQGDPYRIIKSNWISRCNYT